MFSPNLPSTDRCTLFCWNPVCRNANWHSSSINNGHIWHKHLVIIFTVFRLFSFVRLFNECVLRLLYLQMWVCVCSILFLLHFCSLVLCLLTVMAMNGLMKKLQYSITRRPRNWDLGMSRMHTLSCSRIFESDLGAGNLVCYLCVGMEWLNKQDEVLSVFKASKIETAKSRLSQHMRPRLIH